MKHPSQTTGGLMAISTPEKVQVIGRELALLVVSGNGEAIQTLVRTHKPSGRHWHHRDYVRGAQAMPCVGRWGEGRD